MIQRFWIILPVLAGLLLALFFAAKTSPTVLEVARARWDARTFTRYRMVTNYYHNSGMCMQEISVEGNEVTQVHHSMTCNTPLNDIEYPTVNDIFDYVQASAEAVESYRACDTDGCECDVPIGAVGRYHNMGYPRYVEVRPIFERRLRASFFFRAVSCSFVNRVQSSIQIVRLTPE